MPIDIKQDKMRGGNYHEKIWTQSMVNAYLKCPRFFELHYVKGHSGRKSVSLVEGISHHDALDVDNTEKFKTAKPLNVKKHTQAFNDFFSANKKHIKRWEGEKEKDVLSRGSRLIDSYKKADVSLWIPHHDDTGTPLTEYFFRFPLGRHTIQGFIDIVAMPHSGLRSNLQLADYKITKRPKPKSVVDNSVQLSLYSWAMMRKGISKPDRTTASLISFCKENGTINVTGTVFTGEKLRRTLFLIRKVIAAAESGIFPPCSPDSFLCSERYCELWVVCQDRKENP